jgi:diguanylate cyclase (GGDEF)-like protein
MDSFNSLVFDRSPTPMWLKDYSGVKTLVEQWQAEGIHDIYTFLAAHPEQVKHCFESVDVLKVNYKTLELFSASDLDNFYLHVNDVILPNFLPIYADLISQLWEKGEFFIPLCPHYTLAGEVIYLQLRGYLMSSDLSDWTRVLVSTEDITLYQKALYEEEKSRKLAESFFNHSPAALLMENFHPIKSILDNLRNKGIKNLEDYLAKHPELPQHCLDLLQIIDANQSALDLLQAPNKSYLIKNYQRVLIHECMPNVMRHNLLQMWLGVLSTHQESCFLDFNGNIHHVLLQLTVLPNHEHDWARVQVALTDITDIKQAEQRLKFASEHDSLTNVYNRTYYAQELERLEHEDPASELSCIFIDINGLKKMNDQHGHEAGDRLIIQTADVLKKLVKNTNFTLSRIGGDEFIILMPSINSDRLHDYIEQLDVYVEKENQQHTHTLSFSMGFTTRQNHQTIKEMLIQADQLMYKDKQAYYQIHDRRVTTPS